MAAKTWPYQGVTYQSELIGGEIRADNILFALEKVVRIEGGRLYSAEIYPIKGDDAFHSRGFRFLSRDAVLNAMASIHSYYSKGSDGLVFPPNPQKFKNDFPFPYGIIQELIHGRWVTTAEFKRERWINPKEELTLDEMFEKRRIS